MAQGLGDAYVNIIPKAKDITSNMEKVLGGAGGKAGAEKAGAGLGKKLLGGLAKLGIGAAVGGMFKQAFEVGGSLQQSFGGLETIYGDAAAAAKAYAMEAAAAGISANDYAEQAVSFGAALKAAYGGDTTQAMEAANLAIMDMADNAAKMGTPMESIQNAYQGFAKGNYTMLDNLKLGYGGTQEEMKRLLADAEAFSGVKYDMNNLGDVYSAIHVIQGELGLTGVAAGEAKTTLTGSAGAMKASWENLMGAMTTGEGLSTAMENFSSSTKDFATNVFSMLGELAGQLPDLIVGLADIVIDHAPEFIASGVEIVVKIGAGLLEALPELIAEIPDIISAVFETFAEVDWWEIGSDIIMGIIDGLVNAASKLWDCLKSLTTSSWQYSEAELGIASPSKVFADKVGQWIPAGIAEGIDGNLSPLEGAVGNMATTLTGLSDKVPEIWNSFKSAFDGIDWGQLGSDLTTSIGDAITAAKDWLKEKANETLGKVKEAVTSIDWTQLGKDMIDGLINGLTQKASALYEKVKGIISGALKSGQKEAETGSPSKLFARELGRWIPEGIAMGAEQNTEPLDRTMRDIVDGAIVSVPEAPAAAGYVSGSDADRIIAALRELELRADVSLQGDARGLFRVVQQQNTTRTRATGYNALAPAMGR